MKSELKNIIKEIEPERLGVKNIEINSFKKLGVGECNINYLIIIDKKKFVCRVSMDEDKAEKEYESLKLVKELNIAPKPFYLFKKDDYFDKDFLIIEFIEGKPFRQGRRAFEDSQIKELAALLSKLHSENIKLPVNDKTPYQEVFKYAEEFVNKINNYTNSKYSKYLNEVLLEVKKIIKESEEPIYSLIHGDVCPQNVVETKKGMRLIDWESISYSDPARDVTNVIVDFGLRKKRLELFLSEYYKKRKDDTLLRRVKTHKVLTRTNYFLWELVRTSEIINNELPREYIKKTSAKTHLNEAKRQYKELSKLIKIPSIDLNNLLLKNNL